MGPGGSVCELCAAVQARLTLSLQRCSGSETGGMRQKTNNIWEVPVKPTPRSDVDNEGEGGVRRGVLVWA